MSGLCFLSASVSCTIRPGRGGLDRIAHSFPAQLSSGMQRRVEILRALINNPKILLLGEPFRAMDTVSKSRMHRHLLEIYDRFQKTVFFITHDLDEAIFLADTVVVMTTRAFSGFSRRICCFRSSISLKLLMATPLECRARSARSHPPGIDPKQVLVRLQISTGRAIRRLDPAWAVRATV